MTRFAFDIHATDGKARTGTIRMKRGDIRTPAFMPVGTAATVKAMKMEDVRASGADIILGNTYHLMLRPGAERVARLGGLHKFGGWDRPILTDSGGYQVMSLSDLRKITEDGVTFASHLDGSRHLLSPERSMEIQRLLGSDIVMCFDECPRADQPRDVIAKSMEMSMRWAKRSRDAFDAGGEFQSTPIREGEERSGLDRRDFMKIMGASAMMASLAGCTRRPVQKIVPYVNNPEEIIPGLPNYYASACPSTGYGLLVKTREGRPIKVDGNADHPVNRGALEARGQAMVHDLYDPDRLRAPKIDGVDTDWTTFDAAVKKAIAANKGAVHLLSSTIMSPSLKALIAKEGIHHTMVDACAMDDVLDAQAQSYGSRVFPRYRFDKADYIVSIDADFLGAWGSPAEYSRQFAEKRRVERTHGNMNKLVAFESMMSVTGQNADQRVAIRPEDQIFVVLALASEVARLAGRSVPELSAFSANAVAQRTGVSAAVISEVAKELVKFRGRGLVVAGRATVAVQNAVNFLNSTLDNEGNSVDSTMAPSNQYQGSYSALAKLIAEMKSGAVKTLIIQGVNPLYHFAEASGFADALKKVENVIYVTSYEDETALAAKYVAAESHSFETWGDVSAQKEIYSIVQPTLRPLWQSKSLLEMLVDYAPAFGVKAEANAYEQVKDTWKELHKKYGSGKSFIDFWDDALMSGVVGNLHSRDAKASSRSFKMDALHTAVAGAKGGEKSDLVLALYTSVAMGDGFQANNPTLQELPDPVTKNTWGNYASMSVGTAKKLGLEDGDIIAIEQGSHRVELAAHRQAGLKDGVIASALGYGRKFRGRVGNKVGVSFANFTAANGALPSYTVGGIKITKTGAHETLACAQGHHSLEGRAIAFETTLEEFHHDPKSGIEREFENPKSLWSGHEYKGYKWGMAIDMSSCTGCSACVVACSIENNVPAVGKDQVQRGREMQWLRIDRYYSGSEENPETLHQPMLCQHCDNAPCETVCPVLATTHSSEGLNQMTYNRCVGTKYCSNNCPYKVRRFNWYENNHLMNAKMEHPVSMMKNPDVTLRSRGVMEKCTFCSQRIELGKSKAKSEGRRVKDEDIRTACQEACPTDAITFGDVNNPESAVAKMMKNQRGFKVLEELNTQPAINYLTKVRNRAPEHEHSEHGEG